MKSNSYSILLTSLILISITFLTYINILPNQLFYDDEELIYKNAYVADLKFFPRYFTENMVAGAGKTSNMYRPILLTSFAVDHQIWGNNPVGYHLTSIFIHALNSVFVFVLLYLLFGNKLLSFATALLFIIHPIQIETVAYASGRTDLLFSCFSLLSLISFILLIKRKWPFVISFLTIFLSFIFALLSKETAVILPLLFILIYAVKTPRRCSNDPKKSALISVISSFIFLDFVYIFLRLTVLNFANTLNFYQNNNLYSQNVLVRILTFCGVFFQYLGMLFFPKDLIFAREAEIITSFTHPYVLMFVITFSVILSLSVMFWRKNKLFFFSLLWFFITISPVSGIIPINSVIAEHYLYLPSVSFFLLLSFFPLFLWKKFNTPNYHFLLSVLIMFYFTALSARTFFRSFDWRDPISFYTKSLRQSPWNIPMRHNLAMSYADGGNFETAIKEYQFIISQKDVYPNTHHNLGNIYKELKRYKEAEEEYKKALNLDPNFTFSLYALEDLYQKTGEKEKLEEIISKIQNSKSQVPNKFK